ncbi:MAG: 3-deoxy-8-phosphooctulonate synthase [Desulfobulbaceae bacterium]|nr:3-deoxy-8-phosphooctulonate synthase [Desulfobulbaceae bacterium]
MTTITMNSLPKGNTFDIGPGKPLLLLAGPCVLESGELAWEIAREMKDICARLGINYVFKASFDKANRTSIGSFRGPGPEKGLRLLGRLREEIEVPIVSDVHEPSQMDLAGETLDIIQIPAFLCRQTDLLISAARTGKIVNIKKGQFVSPWDMINAVNKIRESGCEKIMLTERGASFGYNNLVVDMRSIPVMKSYNCPVIYDATHSVQLPGGSGGTSGGQREFIPSLSRAAMAVGIDGLFMEVHPNPDKALCDGPNSWALDKVEDLLKQLLIIRNAANEIDNV